MVELFIYTVNDEGVIPGIIQGFRNMHGDEPRGREKSKPWLANTLESSEGFHRKAGENVADDEFSGKLAIGPIRHG